MIIGPCSHSCGITAWFWYRGYLWPECCFSWSYIEQIGLTRALYEHLSPLTSSFEAPLV